MEVVVPLPLRSPSEIVGLNTPLTQYPLYNPSKPQLQWIFVIELTIRPLKNTQLAGIRLLTGVQLPPMRIKVYLSTVPMVIYPSNSQK